MIEQTLLTIQQQNECILALLKNKQELNNENEILNVKQTSEMLDISISHLYKLTSQNIIPFYKVSKKLLFNKQELIKWLQNHRKRTLNELKSVVLSKDYSLKKGKSL